MSELFRSEPLQHSARRLEGAVIMATPPSTRLLAGFFLTAVVAGLCFACSASYARKETVTGWITPDSGLLRAVAVQGGLVEALDVREGDIVAAGQALARIQLSPEIESGDAGQALSASLAAEADAARAGAGADLAQLQSEHQQLRRSRDSLAAERGQVERQIVLQGERIRLAETDLERLQSLADRGFFPRSQLEARHAAALAQEQELAALRQRALSLDRDIIAMRARLEALPIETAAAEAAIAVTAAQLAQRRTDAQSRSHYLVRAPVAGRVAAIAARQGQTLASGAAVATVVPHGSRLEAELYAPSRAIGFIRTGQEVRLLYQAFPHQRFGAGRGEVLAVSPTVLAPNEVAIPGVDVGEPVFRVRVRLSQDYVEAYGERAPLQAGMLLSADIVVDRRSLMEWLLDPIYAAGRR
ncbi:MAG TPA: HlyD family efflux transporter periplasmic adaptor subunit [Vitreimonas sp.]|uniref:HlyD family secretion protein n=1 Tax=Vitreimonas sp. TaxID=3069702 RepID=UPI002D2D1179|nr:HlyD family efflux transporter periplasmic adaptor subunit [Vitreimonas sp.]HYD86027.1 HlyD family efflux transporter periplasmic adaptor subunit [Vitreimonas sp.]